MNRRTVSASTVGRHLLGGGERSSVVAWGAGIGEARSPQTDGNCSTPAQLRVRLHGAAQTVHQESLQHVKSIQRNARARAACCHRGRDELAFFSCGGVQSSGDDSFKSTKLARSISGRLATWGTATSTGRCVGRAASALPETHEAPPFHGRRRIGDALRRQQGNVDGSQGATECTHLVCFPRMALLSSDDSKGAGVSPNVQV